MAFCIWQKPATTLKVKAANSSVCSAQSTHLVSHGAWQLPLLDPTGALVRVVCLSTHAHMQMLVARSGTGGTLDLAGPYRRQSIPSAACRGQVRLSSHSNPAIQTLAMVMCSIYKGLCHSNFYPHKTSVLTSEQLHKKPFK